MNRIAEYLISISMGLVGTLLIMIGVGHLITDEITAVGISSLIIYMSCGILFIISGITIIREGIGRDALVSGDKQ